MVTENNFKFLAPPTIEQIDTVVKKSGVTETQFERYHGLYPGCICHVRIGFRDMPSKFWDLFLEPEKHTNNVTSRKARQTIPPASATRKLKKDDLASDLR